MGTEDWDAVPHEALLGDVDSAADVSQRPILFNWCRIEVGRHFLRTGVEQLGELEVRSGGVCSFDGSVV